MIQILNGLRL